MRGDGDHDGRATPDGAGHRVEGFDEHLFAAVCGAVGRDERHRIADPVDEAAQHQARLVEVGVLGRDADLGRTIVQQRENRTAHYRRAADARGHQVGHPDGQPE